MFLKRKIYVNITSLINDLVKQNIYSLFISLPNRYKIVIPSSIATLYHTNAFRSNNTKLVFLQ